MARASFEEIMKRRAESKAPQVIEQKERESERISFDSAIAKRNEAIQKKRYEGTIEEPQQSRTLTNTMYRNPTLTQNKEKSKATWTGVQLDTYEEARERARRQTSNLSSGSQYGMNLSQEKSANPTSQIFDKMQKAGWQGAKEYYDKREAERKQLEDYYIQAEKDVEAEHAQSRKEWEAANPMATDEMKEIFENVYNKDKEKYVQRKVEEYENPWKKLTNDKYAEYLKNIENNATSVQQREWLEAQKRNLSILQNANEGLLELLEENYKINDRGLRAYVGPQAINSEWYEKMKNFGYDKENAASLYDTYKQTRTAKIYQNMEEDVQKSTGNFWGDLGHSLVSVGANIASVVGASDTLDAGVKSLVTGEYVPVDTHSFGHFMGGYRDAVRQNVTEDIQNADENGNVKWYNRLAGDIYNAGMAVADNLTANAIGGKGVALALMGLSAGAGASKDAFERTGSTGKAIATGAFFGAIEAVTEKLSLDNLYDIYKQSGKAATRNMIVNLLAQSGIEGSEEAISEVANHFVDRAINQDKSEYELNVNQYMNSGMSEEDARKNASKDVFKQVLEAGKIGALAGGIGAGVATAGQQVNKVNTGMEIRGSEMTEDVLAKAEGYEDSKVQKALKKYQEKPSDYAMGKLVYEMQTADAIEQYNSEKQKKGENRENTKISEEIEVEPQAVQNNGQEETISGNDMQMKTEETPVSIPNRVSTEKSSVADTQIETPKRTESKQKVQEAREKMNVAKTAVDLVQARKIIEENGTSEEIEDAKDFFEYRKARLMHSQGVDVQAFAQAESVKTESEAYELGKRNIEIPDVQLTVSSRIAYNEGKYEAALKLNQARTITDRSVISNAPVQTADGKNMVVSKILDVEGEPRLQTKEGTVQLQSVTFLNPTVQKVYNVAATKSNTQLAQTFLDCYPDNIGVYNYNLLFNKFAKAGELGRDFNKVLAGNQTAQIYLSKESLKKIYDAGAKKNVVTESKTETKRDTVKRKGSGQVVDKRNSKAKEELQKVYEKAAEKMGIDIVLKDTDVDDINGSFNQALSEMVLNTKSNTYEALLHEIGEFTDLWNGEDMYTFQTAFMEWYFDEYGDKAAEQIEAYQRAYEKAEGSKSLREASDEMMRDGLAGLFGTEEGVQDFAKWLQDNRSAKESKTILESVAEFFKNLCNKIQSYISNHTLSPTAEAALRLQENKASELRKMFLEATDKAIENYQKAGVDSNSLEDVRHSLEIEEYLTPNEEMLFWKKIGERRKGNVFPKSRNNDSIFMIGNKLVYVGRGYIKPKIHRIVEVSVKEDSDSENTYASFVQEDIINEYEKNRKYEGTSIQDFTRTECNINTAYFGREVNIRDICAEDYKSNRKNGLAGKGQVRQGTHYYFRDIEERRGDSGESKQSTEIRKSLKDTSDLDFFWESNDTYDEVIHQTASVLEEGAKYMQGKPVNEQLVRKIARKLKKDYSSQIDVDTLTDNLTKVFAYMQSQERVNYDDLIRVMNEVATPVIEESLAYDEEEMQVYKEFKDKLKSTPIRLSESQKDEVAYYHGSYENFRRRMFGTLRLSEEGTYLDNIWSELASESYGYLDYDVNPAEQVLVLADTLEMMKPQLRNKFGGDNKAVAMDLSLQIYEEYFKNQANSTIEAYRKKMTHERMEWQSKVRKEYYEKLREEKLKAKNAVNESAKRVMEVRAAYRSSELMKGQERKASEYRHKIKRTGSELIQWIEKPTDKKHVPEVLKKTTLELLKSIDFISHRALDGSDTTIRWQERMRNVESMLNEMERDESDFGENIDISMSLDPDLIPMIRNFVKEGEKTSKISQMDYRQLQELNRILRSLKHTVTTVNEFISGKNGQKISEMANRDIQELQKRKDKKHPLSESTSDMLNWHMLDSYTYFEQMGEGGKAVYRALREGFNKRTWRILEAQDYMRDVLKDISSKELKKWTGLYAEKQTFKVKDGTVTMTTGQIMSLYMLSYRKPAMRHLMAGGIVPSKIGSGVKTIKQTQARHLNEQQLKEITDTLTPKQKELARKIQKFMADNCAKWGNNASMDMFGYKKFNEEQYFPMKVYGAGRVNDKSTSKNASIYAIRNQAMTKNLVEEAKGTLVISDIMDVFVDHVVGMANYEAYAAPISDAMKWYNYRNNGMVGNDWVEDSLRQEYKRVYGDGVEAYFVKLMQDINGEVMRSAETQISDRLLASYKGGCSYGQCTCSDSAANSLRTCSHGASFAGYGKRSDEKSAEGCKKSNEK